MSLNVLVSEHGLKAGLGSVFSAILNRDGWKNVCGHVGFRKKEKQKNEKHQMCGRSITRTRVFFRDDHRIGKWMTRDIYTKMTTNKQTKSNEEKKKCVY